MRREQRLALIGFLFLLPAAILVTGGVLDFQVPAALVHPVLVMGGMLVALGLNALAVLRFRFVPEEGVVVGTLKLRGAGLNLTTVLVGGLLLATILLYLFFENFQPRSLA